MEIHNTVTNTRALKAFETLEDRFNKIHNYTYNYDKAVYKNNTTKIKILCNKHKKYFLQTPTSHLSGAGCPQCTKEKSSVSFEEFYMRAKETHKSKYRYKKTKFKNMNTKTEIVCKKHGIFLQEPSAHVLGAGCPKCNGNQKKSKESFIEEAKLVHGSKYDYSQVVYTKLDEEVNIICKIHGDFFLTPQKHLNGSICPHCKQDKKNLLFFEKAITTHGDKYDYSRVKYKNSSSKVEIICKIHGSFSQVVRAHTDGSGCPKCNQGGRKKFVQK